MFERLKKQCGLIIACACVLLLNLGSAMPSPSYTIGGKENAGALYFDFSSLPILCRSEQFPLPKHWSVGCPQKYDHQLATKGKLAQSTLAESNTPSLSVYENCFWQFFRDNSSVATLDAAVKELVVQGYESTSEMQYCDYVQFVMKSGFGVEAKALMRIRKDLKRPDTINIFADFLDSGVGVSCGYFGCCDYQSTNSDVVDICFDLSQLPRTTVQKVKLLAGFVPEKCLEGCPRQDPCMEDRAVLMEGMQGQALSCSLPVTDRNRLLLQAAYETLDLEPHSRTLLLKGLLLEVGHGRTRREVVGLLITHLIGQQDPVDALTVVVAEGGENRFWHELLQTEDDFLFLNAYHHWLARHLTFTDSLLRDAVLARVESIRGI